VADAPLTSPLPADVGQEIRAVKAQLRRQIGDVAAVFAEVDAVMRAEVTAVAADRAAGRGGRGDPPPRMRRGTGHVLPAAR
jgi:hypothetical protein